MKIFGIGVDILEIARFDTINIVAFTKKILSIKEYTDFKNSHNKNLFLAKTFSIKESVSKAFGVGIGAMLSFKNITIYKNHNGKPLCIVESNIVNAIVGSDVLVHISYSDTKTLIFSQCIIELI